MMTSWNWTFLTDFAPFKPIWLADYNPTDFNFFFHGQSDQARCYIAPERFYCSSEASKFRDPSLSSAMDVFSLGCVLAEIFMEGEVLFDYSQLLQYRDHKFDPLSVLKKIDPSIRALVAHMLQLQPEERWSAKRYLDEWCPHIFPSYFPYMYDIFAKMVRPELANPESKIRFLNHAMPHIVERIFNVKLDSSNPLRANEADYVSLAMQEQLGDEDALTDDTEQMAFDRILSLVPGYMQTTDTTVGLPADSSKPKSQNRVSFWDSLSGKAESKYDIDFSSSNALIADMQNLIFQIDRDTRNFAQRIEASSSAADVLSTALSEKQPSVDQAQRVSAVVTDVSSPLPSDAAIVVLDRVVRERTTQALTPIIALVCVSVRNVRHPLIRLKAIDLLLGMGSFTVFSTHFICWIH
jgi:serine/threonine protein kinase